MDRNAEHQLKLTVVVSFWANQAQYREALKVAEKAMVREVYRDVLSLTAPLRSALLAHDIDRALQIVGEIDEQIGY